MILMLQEIKMTPKNDLIFVDQIEVADKISEILPDLQNYVVVCANLSSVIIADIICRNLKLNFTILFSENIISPNNPDCDIAFVSETNELIINDKLVDCFDITKDFIFGQANRIYEEKILKKIYKYRKGSSLENLKGKNILLIDDGCENELNILVCAQTLSNLGANLISYATPLICEFSLNALKTNFYDIFCIHKILDFVGVDFYYENKIIPKDEIILSILEENPYFLPFKKQGE